MPRRPAQPAVAEEARPSTALTIPQDIRNDLLRTQAMELGERRLPRISILAAGVGQYEFKDTNETMPQFTGIILGTHARNVLWERPYGSTNPVVGDVPVPACSSNDGKVGVPREGFYHAALGRTAVASDRVNCVDSRGQPSCPYNHWRSKRLIPALLRQGENPDDVKGKAVVNQRSVIILVAGRVVPMELILPPTSLTPFDEYVAGLTGQGVPVQAVITLFRQERVAIPGSTGRYAMALLERGADLSQEEFDQVLEMRNRYMHVISPSSGAVEVDPTEVARPQGATAGVAGTETDEIPF
jgi:hypothetical protein